MSQITDYSQIKIIYEDPDFLIIDKPSGLLTHPVRSLARAKGASPEDLGEATSNGTHPVNQQDKSKSVVGWLLEKYPDIKNVGDDTTRPGVVHRLDRETSGLLLIAKTQPTFDYLKKLFAERKIKKTYLALVYGQLKNKNGIIETSLGKLGTRQSTKIHGKHDLKEKPAITEYKVIREFTDYSLLEVSPQTGRTHQIRVHLKSIGYPVVCDPLYAGKKHNCPVELGRLFLHAQKLSFVSPSGTVITVESDLPPILDSFLLKLTGIIKD